MYALSGTAIFWFITLGLTIGIIIGRLMKNEGISVYGNLTWGVIGSLIGGTIAIIFQLGDGLIFALMSCLAMLFLVNVFHQHHIEDLSDDERIVRLN